MDPNSEEEERRTRAFLRARRIDEIMLRVLCVYFILLYFLVFLNWPWFIILFRLFLVATLGVALVELGQIWRERQARKKSR